ncbi:MAG: amidohydrolase family protein [Novosphingobium sp.]|nr:amidohydrolase family protein [Novosphingobium sp.]
MDYDLKISGGRIVDGTGAAAYAGDVAVNDGRIVAIGEVEGDAHETIDAAGAVVAPGFIDCHTHYDAAAFWDPMLSPSVFHGVTTVLAGNCGFTLAPLSGRKEDADYLLAMLSRVEGMPLASLEAAIKPSWTSFGGYLDTIDGKLAINTAFLVGHSALRRTVMGERAVGHEATPDELEAMKALLRESLEAGGCGFSTTASPTHSDHNGDPVPSRWATDEETVALSQVLSEFPGTWLELIPPYDPERPGRRLDLPVQMSLAAQRPLNWNLIVVRAEGREMLESQLAMGPAAAERGAKVFGLVPAAPIKAIVNFRSGQLLESLGDWHEFIHQPDESKIAAMKDPEVRRRLEKGMAEQHANTGLPGKFDNFLIEHLPSQKNAQWIGKHAHELAEASGKSTFDAIFDLAIEEDLQLSISGPELGGDEGSWALRGDVWRHPYSLIGASDAGAHLDSINTFAITTQLMGEAVRERGIFTLEEGVRRITSHLADRFGLTGRGRIEQGAAADLVVFDPDTIDCAPIEMRYDLPGDQMRLYAESIGVHHVIVGGVPVARGNEPTGRIGGRVLRSGHDTKTVAIA